MAQANVDLVRGVNEPSLAATSMRFAAMAPDIEWDESPGMPYGGVCHGRDAIVANVFGPILADVEGFAANPDEILALDDVRVIARGRHGGNGAASRSTLVSPMSGRSPTARCRATSNSPIRADSATRSADYQARAVAGMRAGGVRIAGARADQAGSISPGASGTTSRVPLSPTVTTTALEVPNGR